MKSLKHFFSLLIIMLLMLFSSVSVFAEEGRTESLVLHHRLTGIEQKIADEADGYVRNPVLKMLENFEYRVTFSGVSIQEPVRYQYSYGFVDSEQNRGEVVSGGIVSVLAWMGDTDIVFYDLPEGAAYEIEPVRISEAFSTEGAGRVSGVIGNEKQESLFSYNYESGITAAIKVRTIVEDPKGNPSFSNEKLIYNVTDQEGNQVGTIETTGSSSSSLQVRLKKDPGEAKATDYIFTITPAYSGTSFMASTNSATVCFVLGTGSVIGADGKGGHLYKPLLMNTIYTVTNLGQTKVVSDQACFNQRLSPIPATSVSIMNKGVSILEIGKSLSLNAVAQDATYPTLLWSSSDPNIATVDKNGVVRAKSAGQVVITAAWFGDTRIKDTLTLSVRQGTAVSNSSSWSIPEPFRPETGVLSGTNSLIPTPQISNSIVSLSPPVIKPNNQSAQIIGVQKETQNNYPSKTPVPDKKETNSLRLDKNTLVLGTGQEETLKLIGTIGSINSQKLAWTSSNSSVVAVSDGRVRALKAGTALITVRTPKGETATCRITVRALKQNILFNNEKSLIESNKNKSYSNPFNDNKSTEYKSLIKLTTQSINLKCGETKKVTATTENCKDSKLTWKSSNTKIVSVSANGKLRAHSRGTATILIRNTEGVKTTLKVTVF